MKTILQKRIIIIFVLLSLSHLPGCGFINSKIDDLPTSIGTSDLESSSLRFEVSPPSSISVNQCVPLVFSLVNSKQASVKAPVDLSVTLAGLDLATELFTDSSCLTNVSSLTAPWAKDLAAKVFYFKPSSTQIYTLEVSEAAKVVTGIFKLLQVGSGSSGPEDLRLTLAGPSSFLSGQCKSYTVSLQNTSGAARTSTSAMTINLSGLGSAVAHANTNCTGGSVTSLTLPANTSVVSFSMTDSTAENLVALVDTLTAGVASGFLNIEVQSSAAYLPNQLSMSGVSSITAGACSGPVLVRTLDTFGNSTVAPSNVTFTLSGNLGFSAFSDAGCLTPLLAPQISSGQSAMNYYFTVSSGGTLIINADDGGALLDTALTVNAAAPAVGGSATKIAVVGPSSVTSGTCSSAYLVKTQDNSNIDYAVASNTTINLTGKGAGDFYSDSGCTAIISSLSFSTGDSVKPFYYKSNSVGSLVFNADDAGALTPGSQSANLLAGAATKLALSGSSPINMATCRAYVVEAQDAANHAASMGSNTVIDLTETGSGLFYSNSTCTSPTTSVTILSGQSNASFYYQSSVAGATTITADDLGALTLATLNVTVSNLPASKLVMTRPTLKSGDCSAVTVSVQDSLSGNVNVGANLTVNLSETGAGDFYSTVACTGGSEIASVTVTTGNSSQVFYYKNNSVESVNLQAAAAGLATDSWNTSVGANVPTKLVLTGAGAISAGACVAVSLYSQDAQSNLSPVTSNTLVTLSGVGSGKFSNQSDCGTTTSSLTLTSGQSASAIYYQNNSSQSVTLQAAAAGLTNGTLAVTINAGGETKSKWTLASTGTAGSCLTGSLQIQDALNNPVVQGSARTVNLLDTGSGQFFTSADCSGGAVTSLTVALGQHSVSFSFKDNVAESLVMSASSSGISTITHALTVSAGVNHHLTLNGLASVLAGDCAAYDLRVEDSLNNLSAVGSNTTVNFSGYSNSRFYSDSGCSSQVTSTVVTSGSSQKTVYLKGSVAESLTLVAAAAGLTSANKAVTISTQPAVKLAVTGAASGAANTCQAFTVHVRDQFDNGVIQGAPFVIDLLGNGNGTYYSDAGCMVSVTQVTVGAGFSSQIFYFKSVVAESLQLKAQNVGSGYTDATKAHVVQPLTPSVISLTGLNSIGTSVCVGYTISFMDSLGNLSSVGSAKTVNLTGAGGSGTFYSDSSCGAVIGSTVFTSSQTSAIVYYKATAAQTPTLNADDVGLPNLTAGTLGVTVTGGGGGATLALSMSGASSLSTNVCSPYAVMVVDSGGASVNVGSNLTVNLAGNGSGTFYSDSGCSSSATSVDILTGTSLSFIYYQNASAQNVVFAATSTGASTTTFPVSVSNASGGGGAAKLAWSGTASLTTGSCIPYILSLADSNGNSVNASSNISVTLAGDGAGDFYSDNACSVSLAGATIISTGTSYSTVYFQTATAANLVYIASSAGLSNGTLSVAVTAPGGGSNSGPAVKLAFIAQPSSMATVSTNFDTQPIVAVQDSGGNVVSGASSPITLTAYSDSNCTSAAGGTLNASSNPLNASGGVANFAGVQETHSQTMYLKATSPGLASACSTVVQVYPSIPAKLAFTTQPSAAATAGTALAQQPAVSVLNYTGQLMTGSTNPITLSVYSDSNCSVAASGGTFGVSANPLFPTAGVSTFSGVSYTSASTIYFKAESAGLTSACSTGVTVSAGTGDHLVYYSQPAASLSAGASTSAIVRIVDTYGNVVSSSDTIQLSAHASADCSGGALGGFSNNSQAANLGTAVITGISETITGGMTIKAVNSTTPAMTPACSNSVLVTVGTPAALAFQTQPASTGFAYANLLTQPVVRINDAYGNLVNTATNSITLAAYTDASCTVAAGGNLSVSVNPLNASAGLANYSGVVYSVPETIYLRATSAGLTSACSSAIAVGGVISQLAVGAAHTCALSNSYVYCWGQNDRGQLGNGLQTGPVSTPVQVVGVGGTGTLSNIISISASGGGHGSYYGHTCAVSAAGAVYCWGQNVTGQLGDNTTTDRSYPVQVTGVGGTGYLTGVIKVSAGGPGYNGHTCAVKSDGTAYCWGSNGGGNLGDNTTTQRNAPVQVKGVGGAGNLTGVIDINAASSYYSNSQNYTCAATSSGAAYCWGYNNTGQLGDNSTTQRNAPVQVVGVGGVGNLSNVVQVSGSQDSSARGHTCAVTSTGSAYCWGYNTARQLGNNSTTQSITPVQVLGVGGVGNLSGVTKIATGYSAGGSGHTCAVNSSGTAYCWGYLNGGTQNSLAQVNTPTAVLGEGGVGNLSNIINITSTSSTSNASGNGRICAVDGSGFVYCWGFRGQGAIGDGTATYGADQFYPTKVWTSGAVAYSQIATSGMHTCGIIGGSVYCWGQNDAGQLGDNSTTDRQTPVRVVGVGGTGYLTNIVDIAVTGGDNTFGSTCAVNNLGSVYCWGYGSGGRLGNGATSSSSTPVQVQGITGSVIKISASGSTSSGYVCAVTSAGDAYCWGNNGTSQLGDGTTIDRSSAVLVSGLTNVVDIAASGSQTAVIQMAHTCAVKSDGTVYCWGNNDSGQLGDGTTTDRTAPTQVLGVGGTGNISGVQKIFAAGNYAVGWSSYYAHSCALKTDGSLYCWGNNGSGQLGDNTTTQRTSPVQVKGISGTGNLSGVTKVALSYNGANIQFTGSSCAITASGLVCWGYGSQYSLGTGITSNSSVPILTELGATNVISVSGAHGLGCAVTSSGSGYCWGTNGSGSDYMARGVGNNTYGIQNLDMVSSPVPSGISVTSVTAGQNQTCVSANNGAYCWGAGTNGALGNCGTANVSTSARVLVSSGGALLGPSQVSSGGTQGCAMTPVGILYCWGDNFYGNLGINNTTQSSSAIQVLGVGGVGNLSSVTNIASGYRHNCAVGSGGQVYCWGWNGAGQLGNNSTTAMATPTAVLGIGGVGNLTGATKVVSGYSHSCAIVSGNVRCWGNNSYGQLGNNSTANSKIPVNVLDVAAGGSLSGITDIAAGAYHTCAVGGGGQVFCWGYNSNGQLGDDSLVDALYPVGSLTSGFVALTGMTKITAGLQHTCALSSGGAVYCWGGGGSGQLGNNGTLDIRVANQVVGVGASGYLTGIAGVAAGAMGKHTCAMDTAGTAVYCWGLGSSGQLGNGTTPSAQSTPVSSIVVNPGVDYFIAK